MKGGDRVRVLAPHAAGLAARRVEDGVVVETFRYAPERFEAVGYGRSLRADERLAGGGLLAAPLYLAGARRALRTALRTGPCDLVQAHWVVPNALVAATCVGSTPLVVGLHGSDVFMAEKPLIRTWTRWALRRTSAVTSCSPELARRIGAIGFPAERTSVIPYGVDSELFRPDPARRGIWRERLGIPDGAPLLLGVGRMATKKGFHLLLAALPELFRRHPEAHVVLAGGGDRLEEWRREAATLSGAVHFPGAVQHDTLPDLYRAADLFVLPAVHDAKGNVDGLPNVILEAMASGLAVVASRVSGIPIAITQGEQGWLIEEGDVAALAGVLAEAVAGVEARRQRGRAARQRAEREFTWEAVAARYRAAYLAALGRPAY